MIGLQICERCLYSRTTSQRLPERRVGEERPPGPSSPERLHQLLVLRSCWLVKIEIRFRQNVTTSLWVELHFKVFKEAKAPEAAAQACEPPGVAWRVGGCAATPLGAAWERSARCPTLGCSLLPPMLFPEVFFTSLDETELSRLFHSPYVGKSPLECFLGSTFFLHTPLLCKVSPFPRGSEGTGESSKRTRATGRLSTLPLLPPTFPLTTGDGKP